MMNSITASIQTMIYSIACIVNLIMQVYVHTCIVYELTLVVFRAP